MLKWYDRLWVWVRYMWWLMVIFVLVAGVAIWGVFLKPPRVVAQVVQQTVVVEKQVEVTKVVEKIVTATPAARSEPTPTRMSTPSATAIATTVVTGTGTITPTEVITQGMWSITYYSGTTPLMKGFVFTDPDRVWAKFPNVDWPAQGFLAKNGLEYGQELSSYCQQDGRCDIVVASRSYRSITGDWKVNGIGECAEGGTGIGCALLLFNVGDVSAMLRDQRVDTGHTITGLYWNGDEIDQAVSALASHIRYRMIGIPSGNPANPGANCSVPTGCKGVDITFVILSGNEMLVKGHTVVR